MNKFLAQSSMKGIFSMYQNYIFDLYGTLADIHTDEEQPLLWEK